MVQFQIGKCAKEGSAIRGVAHAHNRTDDPLFGTICISHKVMRYWRRHPAYGWNHVMRMLLHEVAHLQTPDHGHDKTWWTVAAKLGAHRNWLGKPMPEAKPKRVKHIIHY